MSFDSVVNEIIEERLKPYKTMQIIADATMILGFNNMSDALFRYYLTLQVFSSRNGYHWHSIDGLSKLTGKSKGSIKKYNTELAAIGAIVRFERVKPDGNHTSNVTIIMPYDKEIGRFYYPYDFKELINALTTDPRLNSDGVTFKFNEWDEKLYNGYIAPTTPGSENLPTLGQNFEQRVGQNSSTINNKTIKIKNTSPQIEGQVSLGLKDDVSTVPIAPTVDSLAEGFKEFRAQYPDNKFKTKKHIEAAFNAYKKLICNDNISHSELMHIVDNYSRFVEHEDVKKQYVIAPYNFLGRHGRYAEFTDEAFKEALESFDEDDGMTPEMREQYNRAAASLQKMIDAGLEI